MLLARLGTLSNVGQFGLAIAVTAPIIMFVGLQLRLVQATDRPESEFSFLDYLTVRLIGLAIGMAAICAITFSISCPAETRLIILLMGIAKFIEAISDIYHGAFQKYERMDLFSRSLLIKGPLSTVVFAIIFARTHSLAWAITGLAATWGFVLVWHDAAVGRLLDTQRDRSRALSSAMDCGKLWRLVRVALPLGLVTGLMSLEINIPRYFVSHWCGAAELGHFVAIGYVLFAGEIVVVALTYAAVPRLAKLHRAGSKSFWSTLGKLLVVAVLLGIVGCVLVKREAYFILNTLLGTDYGEQADAFVLLAFAATLQFCTTTLALSLRAMRRFRTLVVIRLIITGILLGNCAYLIPQLGVMGAAWSVLIAAGCHAIVVAMICGLLLIRDTSWNLGEGAQLRC